jgi:hypothetical protein
MGHTVNEIYRSVGAAAPAADGFSAGIGVDSATNQLTYNDNGTQHRINSVANGGVIAKSVLFTENATATTHTGSVVIPALSTLIDIIVTSEALWTGGTATMKVGDAVDDDGYFTGVDLNEVLSLGAEGNWGGKQGAYLVAATGRNGAVATNFGTYLKAGTTIKGIVTVGTPATTVGRTFMTVIYSTPTVVAATAA